MRLDNYNVTLIISDPDDEETNAKAILERCPRETLLKIRYFGALLETFESVTAEETKKGKKK